MFKRKIVVDVKIDVDRLINTYPNYRFNFSSPAEFVRMIAKEMECTVFKEYGCILKAKIE